jgi:hypothetical protein
MSTTLDIQANTSARRTKGRRCEMPCPVVGCSLEVIVAMAVFFFLPAPRRLSRRTSEGERGVWGDGVFRSRRSELLCIYVLDECQHGRCFVTGSESTRRRIGCVCSRYFFRAKHLHCGDWVCRKHGGHLLVDINTQEWSGALPPSTADMRYPMPGSF